ncbi:MULTISPECIES: hypothetical protein [Desulfosporosinus]|uniref:Uncharacterized protein n=1 Tax=Desulfosporosinus acididurans TaxID=476652 RepID=A0A0J1IJH5_9FIRM|nr:MULTISPECIES: hypothetical protein [Desulfosporosinus]KLU64876.1 hypothetical protein DEAC_c32040 [Desulfosporosinus acididurans]
MLSGILGIIVMIAIYGVVIIDYRQQSALTTKEVKSMLNRKKVFKLNNHIA